MTTETVELKEKVWYVQGSFMYILKDNGTFTRKGKEFVPNLVNDFVIKVESQNNHFDKNRTQSDIELREAKLADHIKKLLDENPFVE